MKYDFNFLLKIIFLFLHKKNKRIYAKLNDPNYRNLNFLVKKKEGERTHIEKTNPNG